MKFVFTVLMLFLSIWGRSQYNFDILQGKQAIQIPFELDNNFIVIRITVNKTLPLRFIFDTGAEHTILTKGELSASLGLRYEREFQLIGADLQTQLTAYLSRRNHLQVGDAIFPSMDLLVLKEDYLHIEEYTGTAIHGILGADFFKRFVVKIDYRRKEITLESHNSFVVPSKYREIPVEIHRHKPYIRSHIQLQTGSAEIPVKLLIDTGASLSLLIHNETSPALKLPEQVISGKVGMGLGGVIEGFIGRLQECCIGKNCFDNIITNFQTLDSVRDTSFLNGRNGLIGSTLLQRFTIYIDYVAGRLYVRPHRRYKRAFRFDRSGLGVIASGENLSQFVVQQVLEGSPADEAGVQIGDEILKINGVPSALLTLQGIAFRFQRRGSKKIKLLVRRNGRREKLDFQLRDLI
ncbi:MAG: aspartyl protease family protein [Bacteroidota bacterium]